MIVDFKLTADGTGYDWVRLVVAAYPFCANKMMSFWFQNLRGIYFGLVFGQFHNMRVCVCV